MNIDSIKRLFRGWLPPQPSNLQKIKNYSTPIAIGLLITVVSLSAFIVSSNLISGYSAIKPMPVIPTANGTTADQNSTQVTSPQNSTITQQQALALAVPLIQKYATENNRTVTNIIISSQIEMMADLEGKRGGPTLEQILSSGNLTSSEARSKFVYYPVWTVDATFQWEMPQPVPIYNGDGNVIGSRWPSNATWINGFDVIIWADNGQVADAKPIGVM